jgi:hypothetical protein
MELEWITLEQTGNVWGLKSRWVQAMCSNGQIPGVVRLGRIWLIPKNAQKPVDGRTKAAKELGSWLECNIFL